MMVRYLLILSSLVICGKSFAARSIMEGLYTTSNSLYVATNAPHGYVVVGGSLSVNGGSIGTLFGIDAVTATISGVTDLGATTVRGQETVTSSMTVLGGSNFAVSSGKVVVGTNTAGGHGILEAINASQVMGGWGTATLTSSDLESIDKGPQLVFAGNINNASFVPIPYASIMARKENSTNNNYDSYLAFGTASNVLADIGERMRITSGGKVGIGTTGPATKLQVNNGTASIYQPAKQTLGLISQLHVMAFGMGSTNDLGQIAFGYDNALSYAPGVIGSIVTNQSGDTAVDLIFATRNATTDTAPSERMRITAGGNVGIGTESPGYPLDVSGDINTTGAYRVNGSIIGAAAVSSVTYIPSGSSTQSTFNLAYATVTLTLNGGFDLDVTVNCAATAVTDCSLGWSVLYDGSNSKFGLGSATGVAWQNSTNTNFHQNISATFQVKASEITSGSHSFAFSPAVCAGNTITWPATQGSQQSSCRFGVKEIH